MVVAGTVVLVANERTPDVSVSSATTMPLLVGVFLVTWSITLLAQPSPIEYAQRFWNAGEARPTVRLAGASVMPMRGGALAGVTLVF